MAKSIRSKSKRKFRAVKRTKSLKKMKDELQNIANFDVKLVTLPFVTRNVLLTASRQEPPPVTDLADQGQKVILDQAEPMETSKAVSIRNEHGNYPVWMNKRERKRQIRLYRMKKRSKKR
ncbi:hypothetical protein CLF_104942 [Clonorchis sinensis]|uniref:Protein LLP homolog n=1 Tax=Clonorchis sinensis TaxID=79923 RepID=H2KQX6_CLOSI|nr:hypothetical protein CLF_104942 [Clonorchis sinensis]